eukprot:5706284-Prymnesium_polylepis.2
MPQAQRSMSVQLSISGLDAVSPAGGGSVFRCVAQCAGSRRGQLRVAKCEGKQEIELPVQSPRAQKSAATSDRGEHSMTSSFDFPGWKFSGRRGHAQPSPSSEPASARDWLDDLDDLEGGAEDGPAALDDAHMTSVPPTILAEGLPMAQECTTAADTAPAAPASNGWLDGSWPDDVLFAVLHKLTTVPALCKARAVTARWRDVASSDVLWKGLWESHERLSARPPRVPCGSAVLALPAERHVVFR